MNKKIFIEFGLYMTVILTIFAISITVYYYFFFKRSPVIEDFLNQNSPVINNQEQDIPTSNTPLTESPLILPPDD